MKKKIKGFTLIELLAVIVILAIILLIAMPIVLNVIGNARKGAFESSALGLIKTAENECLSDQLSGIPDFREILFVNWEMISEEKLNFSGRGPLEGYINVNAQCEVQMAIHDGRWCIIKDYHEKEITTILYDGVCDINGDLGGYPYLQNVGHESFNFEPLDSLQIHNLINNENWIPIANKTELKQIEGISSASPVTLTFGLGTEFEMEHGECNWDEIDEMCYGYYAGGMNQNYILVADIDLEGAFEPIGYDNMGEWAFQTFSGNFNGNGHRIYNGVIDYPTMNSIGIFAIVSVSGQTTWPFAPIEKFIENLIVEDVIVNGQSGVGIVAGRTTSYSAELGPTFRNVHVSGTVNGNGTGVGGIVGLGDQMGTFTIEYSSSAANVTNIREVEEPYGSEMIGWLHPGAWTGGLAGRSSIIINSSSSGTIMGDVLVGGLAGVAYGNIYNSYATGDIIGIGNEDAALGGLVGASMAVNQSFATGNVSGNLNLGGLTGENHGEINNSYATGNVLGDSNIGGLVGNSSANINNSYAIGNVASVIDSGGLVGISNSLVNNSYYNSDTTSQTDSDRGLPRTTNQLMDPYDETTTYLDWDFVNIWTFGN